jgi:hypothetical protein
VFKNNYGRIMEKVKRAFLFGAGAVLEWGAPKTSELTDLALNIGFKMSDSKTYVTRFIYDTLINNGYSEKDVNFETIISVIEELIVYYSDFDSSKHIPSIHKCFFESKFKDEILNFSIEGGKRKHGYILEIPKGVKFNYARNSYQNETPEQFYFEHLLGEILTNICALGIDYSFHSKVDLESESSKSFIEWMELHSKQTSLRLYTLNYDRIPKILLTSKGHKIFEGFDCDDYSKFDYNLRPNVLNILNDLEGNVYYNLHGSIYWDVDELDFNQLQNAEIYFKKFPNLPANNTPASLQIEKGKTLMVTNIITGYQKAQKAMISPFKQMQSSFDRDCCFADELYIIGYSFGDEHINASLRTALRHNQDLKMIIVDPFFMKNDLDLAVSLKIFSASDKHMQIPKKLDEDVHSHFGGSFIVYTISFKEFRERQLNPFNKAAGGIMMP